MLRFIVLILNYYSIVCTSPTTEWGNSCIHTTVNKMTNKFPHNLLTIRWLTSVKRADRLSWAFMLSSVRSLHSSLSSSPYSTGWTVKPPSCWCGLELGLIPILLDVLTRLSVEGWQSSAHDVILEFSEAVLTMIPWGTVPTGRLTVLGRCVGDLLLDLVKRFGEVIEWK